MISKSSVLLSLRCLKTQLATKSVGLLVRKKNGTEDRNLVLGQLIPSIKIEVEHEVGKEEEESEVIRKD